MLGKHRGLVGDAALAIGVAEVGHERHLVDLGQGVQAAPRGAKAARGKTQAVHARIHFQKHPLGHLGFVAAEHVNLRVAMHRVPQVQARAQLQIARLKHPFEQQDGPAPAQVAHALGFVQVQQSKAVGPAQTLKHPLDAMAVGIGLHHRPDPRILRARTQHSEVVL